MGRPSKLTDSQWAEIGRRLAKGERAADLAREYKVSKTRISARFSERIETLKTVAKQVADAETVFASLTVSEQCSVRSLADDLKLISTHLASAARYGSMTAHRLSAVAQSQVERIDDTAPLSENAEALQSVATITKIANLAAEIPLNLLSANKDMVKRVNDDTMPGNAGVQAPVVVFELPDNGRSGR